jgi:phage shock protein C
LREGRRHGATSVLGGVCGGIADSFGWNPTVVRILYVVISTLSVAIPGILIYIVLWLLIPKDA